jgi:nucleoside-diphosphate-sugar epimerase
MDRVVLLTGATGFIGRHAIAPLLARGYQVHALTSRPAAGQPALPGVTWQQADLLIPGQVEPLLAALAPTHLLHFAWYVETGKFWSAPANLEWVEASLRLVRAFAACGGQRLVMAGTCAEYDWGQPACCSPDTPLRPATLYGAAKLAVWLSVERFAASRRLSAAWGRIFSPFGPDEHPARLVAATIRSLLRGEEARCSHGGQVRDFLYTPDLADAFVALLDSPMIGALDMAAGHGTTIAELVMEIAHEIRRPDLVRLGALAAPANDPPQLVGNITRLAREVRWQPAHTRAAALAQTIDWWRNHL